MNTKEMQKGYLDLTGRGQGFVNNLMPNMQNIAQTQQAPAAPQRWIPPTVQANPNQQFVGYGQSDQFHGQPIDPVRLAIGRALQFDTSPTWAHNLPMSALPQAPATPKAPAQPQPLASNPSGWGSPTPQVNLGSGPGGQWVGPDGKPASGIDPGFFTGNKFIPNQSNQPTKTMIPRTGRKGPGYGTPSYQKGK